LHLLLAASRHPRASGIPGIGSVSRNLLFGFTEPYFRNRPLSLGFQIYSNKTDYNASKNYKLSTGTSRQPRRFWPSAATRRAMLSSHRRRVPSWRGRNTMPSP